MKCRILLLVLMLLLSVGMPLLAHEEAEAHLRIGILPVENNFPVYIAEIEGYFKEMGVAVDLVPYLSAADMRAAVIAGELDGFHADLVSGLVLREAGVDMRLVRHIGTHDVPMFALLSNRLESAEQLRGESIGLSMGTVTQYIVDELLATAGIAPDEVDYVDLPGIQDRRRFVMSGEVAAALIPSPYIAFGERFGLKNILDDAPVDYVPEAIFINTRTLEEMGEDVRAFLSAYERSLHLIQSLRDDDDLRSDVTQGVVDRFFATYPVENPNADQIRRQVFDPETLLLPRFDLASVPTEEEFAYVQEWALEAGLVTEARAYEDVIDGSFLPEMMDDEMDMDDDMSEEDEE